MQYRIYCSILQYRNFLPDVFVAAFFLDSFKDFLSNDFDVKEYANTIIESQLIGESLSKLADGVSLLNKEILNQVICQFSFDKFCL